MTTTHEIIAEAREIQWWILPVEFSVLALLGVGFASLLFSLLPISVAILVFVIALLTFPVLRKRSVAWQHMICVVGLWIILSIVFLILVLTIRPEHFGWLLDWS